MKYVVILIFSFILISCCRSTTVYQVRVQNNTDQVLIITPVGLDGKPLPSIQIDISNTALIYQSPSLPKSWFGELRKNERCSKILQSVRATTEGGTMSNNKWCKEEVSHELIDIGEAEFTMIYTQSDFE